MRRKGALEKAVCPISHDSCKLCSLYIGRHYQAFLSCQDYLRRLHDAAAPKEKKPKTKNACEPNPALSKWESK